MSQKKGRSNGDAKERVERGQSREGILVVRGHRPFKLGIHYGMNKNMEYPQGGESRASRQHTEDTRAGSG